MMINNLIDLTNSMGDRWMTWVLANLLDASVLLILCGALWLLIQRRVAPQVGYCLFLLVPLKLLLPVNVTAPAAIARWTPSVGLSTWIDGTRDRGNVSSRPQIESHDEFLKPHGPSVSELRSPSQTDMPPPWPAESTTASASSEESSRPIALPSPQSAEPNAAVAIPTRSKAPRLNVSSTAMLMWFVGVAFLVGRLALIQLRFRKRIARLETVEASRLGLDLRELCRRVGVTRPVRVVLSDDVSAPAVWGIFQPTIILPKTIAAALSSRQLQWVLLHELAHIRRVDLLVVACQRLAAVVHFFNPAVWIANRMIHRLREYACDDLAVSLSDGSCVDSGEAFLLILRQENRHGQHLNGALGVFGLDSRAACFARVRRLMDTDRPIRIGLDRWSVCGLVILAAIAVPRIHAAQDAKKAEPGPDRQPVAQLRAGANNNLAQSDNPIPDAATVLAKDAGRFELNVVGPDGKPIPEAAIELWSDPSPAAEQIQQGQFVRLTNSVTFVTADSEGRVVVKWPQSPEKVFIVRILVSSYPPYWASWASENDSAPVPAKSTIKLAEGPMPEGLTQRPEALGHEGGGIFFVVARSAVRRAIGVEGAAANKLQSIAEQYCEEMSTGRAKEGQMLRHVAELKDLSPEDQAKKIQEYFDKQDAETKATNEKFLAQLKAALTSQQFERLQQITRQVYGSEAWRRDAELAKALELTGEQNKKVFDINRDYQFQQNESIRAGASFAKSQELDRERNGKVKEVLTPEQREMLAKLEGQPFDLALLTPQIPRQQFGLFGGSMIVMTAANEAVQKDLGLSADAAKQVNELKTQYREARFGLGGGFIFRRVRVAQDVVRQFEDVELPPWDFGEWKAVTSKFLPKLQAALTADQYIRLQQIDWQVRGTAAYGNPEVIQALALTKEQQENIASITDEYRSRQQEMIKQGSAGGGADLSDKVSELIKEHDSKIDGSLTKAQLETFALMKGKAFDVDQLRMLDPIPRPGRGPGGPGLGASGAGGPGADGPRAGGPARGGPGAARYIYPFVANGGIFSVVKNEAVQKELGLTPDDTTKALAIATDFNKTWHEAGGGFRIRIIKLANGGMRNFQEAAMPPWGILPFKGQSEEERTQEFAKMMDLWKATTAKFQAQLKDALTADQYTRLQQINWQAMGTAAFYSDAEVIEALAISNEQQLNITSITNDGLAKRLELISQAGGGGPGIGEKMSEMHKEQDAKINDSLTAEQLAKLAMMKGKEFDVGQLRDAERPRFPGRGNGGGEDERPK